MGEKGKAIQYYVFPDLNIVDIFRLHSELIVKIRSYNLFADITIFANKNLIYSNFV